MSGSCSTAEKALLQKMEVDTNALLALMAAQSNNDHTATT